VTCIRMRTQKEPFTVLNLLRQEMHKHLSVELERLEDHMLIRHKRRLLWNNVLERQVKRPLRQCIENLLSPKNERPNNVHPVERDIRTWSRDFLEIPNAKLNGLPPCPYARKAWADDKVVFSINTGIDGLLDAIRQFDSHDYDIVVWAEEDLPDMDYLDGLCDGMNELMSIAGIDLHLMVFHPDYDATEAGLEFLVDDEVTDDSLSYCMVFVQKLSKLDDAALYLEKSNYYEHFPEDVYDALVLDRRRLRNANAR
jgi:hypothetical protein